MRRSSRLSEKLLDSQKGICSICVRAKDITKYGIYAFVLLSVITQV